MLAAIDLELATALRNEFIRQNMTIELIASESFVPPAILEVQGSILTNKYAEGYPGRRYHGGCQFIDEIESMAIERCKQLFGCEYANVQPHSGVNANLGVFMAILKPGDTILGMDLQQGGHLSHGARVSISGQVYRAVAYGLNPDSELIDYDQVRELAKKHHPKLIIAGASAYSRFIDYKRFREIADEVGAYLMVDMAHVAGLVAAGVHPSPVPYAHFVTTTTTKTMRGARGGVIMALKEFGPRIDRAVFPGIQGGAILQNVAAKALTFKLAMTEEFRNLQRQVAANAKAMASFLQNSGYRIVSGGTDNHLMLVDLRSKGITGKEAEECLDTIGITVNKNMIPFDPAVPDITSGIRIGTTAMTSRGLKETEMKEIAQIIVERLEHRDDPLVAGKLKERVKSICRRFPLYLEREEAQLLPFPAVES
ncbi:aminotransferase class I/II-fold pyridoxal phosphate-dependent enzyme [Desulfofundulus thermobenzoicus]|uniref:2-methylserine hydroxymethyltransferase n=1 Tax=Desulfofundulus thermobenzoicus TaxID=29376 RepID=A0A6N7INZ2_9FIRM|nr:serine hydroxymethyltransferase [Desulfofundulus thermobenzoicus]MQL51704.1 aminotransferase class I/II-fold pyridoxal phosphate-dependent enzyme [Desulfofundulus thermobenzoicus]HHW45209.1 serine hydroxymethyltransferase [Desulfotomaculum sp.]